MTSAAKKNNQSQSFMRLMVREPEARQCVLAYVTTWKMHLDAASEVIIGAASLGSLEKRYHDLTGEALNPTHVQRVYISHVPTHTQN